MSQIRQRKTIGSLHIWIMKQSDEKSIFYNCSNPKRLIFFASSQWRWRTESAISSEYAWIERHENIVYTIDVDDKSCQISSDPLTQLFFLLVSLLEETNILSICTRRPHLLHNRASPFCLFYHADTSITKNKKTKSKCFQKYLIRILRRNYNSRRD